jgi:hypothetical protein
MAEVRTGTAHPQVVALVRRAGWLTAGLGVILLVLGWYGVSGQSVVAEQVPYLASASIPGAALVIGGLVLAGAERVRGRAGGIDEATARRIAELHGLLVEPVPTSMSVSVSGPVSAPELEPEPGPAADGEPDR